MASQSCLRRRGVYCCCFGWFEKVFGGESVVFVRHDCFLKDHSKGLVEVKITGSNDVRFSHKCINWEDFGETFQYLPHRLFA